MDTSASSSTLAREAKAPSIEALMFVGAPTGTLPADAATLGFRGA